MTAIIIQTFNDRAVEPKWWYLLSTFTFYNWRYTYLCSKKFNWAFKSSSQTTNVIYQHLFLIVPHSIIPISFSSSQNNYNFPRNILTRSVPSLSSFKRYFLTWKMVRSWWNNKSYTIQDKSWNRIDKNIYVDYYCNVAKRSLKICIWRHW